MTPIFSAQRRHTIEEIVVDQRECACGVFRVDLFLIVSPNPPTSWIVNLGEPQLKLTFPRTSSSSQSEYLKPVHILFVPAVNGVKTRVDASRETAYFVFTNIQITNRPIVGYPGLTDELFAGQLGESLTNEILKHSTPRYLFIGKMCFLSWVIFPATHGRL